MGFGSQHCKQIIAFGNKEFHTNHLQVVPATWYQVHIIQHAGRKLKHRLGLNISSCYDTALYEVESPVITWVLALGTYL